MKYFVAAITIVILTIFVYSPFKNAEFILDDYYTVVRNPLIKNPLLYKDIWFSNLFDAHQSSGYIKFGYYRPILESSWILDYHFFGLNATGYRWINLFIHAFNCFLIYLLLFMILGRNDLALKTGLLFCVIPSQEWVVRYVTGRGDELSVFFALLSLIAFHWVLTTRNKLFFLPIFACWALSALTREVAISYIFYAFLIHHCLFSRGENKGGAKQDINTFSLYWVLISLTPFILLFPTLPKQGNILVLHFLYFACLGICLWMAQLRWRWVVLFITVFSSISFYQGQYWTTEKNLLEHTRKLEWWPRTVTSQQLLMKYDDNIPGITDVITHEHDPIKKAMWLRRLGIVYFKRNDLEKAQDYFNQAIQLNPLDVDTLNALAVVFHHEGKEAESVKILEIALKINPSYPDTLRTLGIHYYLQKDYVLAQKYLANSLFFDPTNTQAQELLRLAKAAN